MCGPWRDRWFEPGLCEDYGYSQYGVPSEITGQQWVTDRTWECSDHQLLEAEDFDADACIDALEWGQREMKQDLKEAKSTENRLHTLRIDMTAMGLRVQTPAKLKPRPVVFV
ncbi:UNVERIFIED_CONTAM: hypothetical protein K2H54_004110 [Gekko kuhli]